MRILVAGAGPTADLFGETKNNIFNAILDEAGNLVHEGSAQDFRVEKFRRR
jgi:hypothetical protein